MYLNELPSKQIWRSNSIEPQHPYRANRIHICCTLFCSHEAAVHERKNSLKDDESFFHEYEIKNHIPEIYFPLYETQFHNRETENQNNEIQFTLYEIKIHNHEIKNHNHEIRFPLYENHFHDYEIENHVYEI